MRLLELIQQWDLSALSRIVVEPGPGTSCVTGTFAGTARTRPMALYDSAGLEPLRGPGQQAQSVLTALGRPEDAEGRVDSKGLRDQVAELDESGILGTLNVERLGRRTVISTHAGSQRERTEWLRSVL
jgi:hypothetical protein